MPQNKTETVTFKLPSGEMVDAIIPAGMSDAEAKAFMVAKKPDLFRTSSARTPQEAGVLPPEMQAREAIFKNMGMSFGSTRPDPLPEQEFRGTRVVMPELLGAGGGPAMAGSAIKLLGGTRGPAIAVGEKLGKAGVSAAAFGTRLLRPTTVREITRGVLGKYVNPTLARRLLPEVEDELMLAIKERRAARWPRIKMPPDVAKAEAKAAQDAFNEAHAALLKKNQQLNAAAMRRGGGKPFVPYGRGKPPLRTGSYRTQADLQAARSAIRDFPKPLRPLVGSEAEWAAFEQQMRVLEPEAKAAGMFHAARGATGKLTDLQQRMLDKFLKVTGKG